jgi:selenocysteine-specific elongation factor
LTKIDLALNREALLREQIAAQLRDTPFAHAPIVATSTVSGTGVDDLRRALATTLADTPVPSDTGKPRLPVDRVFTLHGIGTVVTGTLSGGMLRRNQSVFVQPLGKETRIRSLQSHGHEVEEAVPGTRTALNLPDLPVATDRADGIGVSRGQVITFETLGQATRTLDVWLERSSRLLAGPPGASRLLRDGARVQFHHGSGHTPARVVLLENVPLLPGHNALAQIRTEHPVFVLAGDRFILRDWPEQHTIAGGLVLDAAAPRRFIRNQVRRALLLERALQPARVEVWLETQLRRDHARLRSGLLAQTRWAEADVQDALGELVRQNKVLVEREWVLEAAWWNQQLQFAETIVAQAHQTHPEKPGVALGELRRTLAPRLPEPSLCDLLLTVLVRRGYVQVGNTIRHASHQLALPPKLESTCARLRAALAAKPFEPPAKKELLRESNAQQALRFLLDSGEAVELAVDLVMLSEPFAHAQDLIRRHLQERGSATASDLRQLLGTNRRVIIPLLERLDRDGLTVRQGDTRVLKGKP